jgi:hypothetical protein
LHQSAIRVNTCKYNTARDVALACTVLCSSELIDSRSRTRAVFSAWNRKAGMEVVGFSACNRKLAWKSLPYQECSWHGIESRLGSPRRYLEHYRHGSRVRAVDFLTWNTKLAWKSLLGIEVKTWLGSKSWHGSRVRAR